MRHLTIAILMLAACKSEAERPATPTKELPVLEHRSQQDLAKELDAADVHGSWTEIKHRWQGQAVTWNVTRYRALCRTAEACNVAVFPIQRPAKHGWMPEVRFAPGQWEALEAKCGDSDRCEVTLSGTLGKLDASAEMPTNVRLDDVKLAMRTAAR